MINLENEFCGKKKQAIVIGKQNKIIMCKNSAIWINLENEFAGKKKQSLLESRIK